MDDRGFAERQRFLRTQRAEDLPWGPIQAVLVTVALLATLSLS